MDNFKAVGIDAAFIQNTARVLAQNRDFIVLVNHTYPSLWFQRRVLSNPSYHVTHLALFKNDINIFDLWQVHTL
jgi:hypothetical protein